MARRGAWLAVVATLLALGLAQSAAAAPTVIYDCSPTPQDCTGWYRSNVGLDWTVLPSNSGTTGCQDTVLTTDSKAAYQYCSASAGTSGRTTVELYIHIDKTPPQVTGASAARPPDANGWYRAPVSVAFRGSDATSGVRTCTTPTYAGPDNGSARVSGTCADIAGNTSLAGTFGLRYDATGPDITRGRPARKPDYHGWYNHPVMWRFRGRDGLSGLADCPSVLFAGPDGRAARVVGACRDKAGNVGTRSFALRYDATPPAAPLIRAVPRDRRVKLNIGVAPDVRRIAIVRRPGRHGTRDSTVYKGRPHNFTDRHVRNGRRYTYTVIASDQAANRSRSSASAVPHVELITPPDGAVVAAAPLLRWTPVHNADYYNVQLRRDGHKVLSRWPERPRYQVRTSWHFGGRVHHLAPGTYRWDVWPGFGPRSRANYGRRIGGRKFVIPAASPVR
jgi:hypothetical protein